MEPSEHKGGPRNLLQRKKGHSSTAEAPSDNQTEATGSQTTEPVAELTAEGVADPITDATMEAKEEPVATPQ